MFTVHIAGSVARYVRGQGWTVSDAMMERLLVEQTPADAKDPHALSIAVAAYGPMVKGDTVRTYDNTDCVDPSFEPADEKPESIAKAGRDRAAYEATVAKNGADLFREAGKLTERAAEIGGSNATTTEPQTSGAATGSGATPGGSSPGKSEAGS